MNIIFAGDISLNGLNSDLLKLDESIKTLFSSSDIVVGNLETPITNSDLKKELLPVNLKADGNSIHLLKNFDILNLGNNHTFDFGIYGYNDTIAFLEKNSIRYFGAGENLKQAQNPLKIITYDEFKIAIITGTRWNNASKKKYGTSGFVGHKKNIIRLKKDGYFVIYFPHWGYEYIAIPPPDVRSHAKKMIKYGVDLIVGTHPHVLQGYEKFKGKYIFYSLGNFIFHSEIIETLAPLVKRKNCTSSVLLQINVQDDKKYRYRLHPIQFNDVSINLINEKNYNKVLDEIEKMSMVFKLSYFDYLKSYYNQVPSIVEQNIKIRNQFQNFHQQSVVKKIKLLNNITKQDLYNRLFFLYHKSIK
jgi:poly-gamma-glutamate capsule biosynthesis protein CapA/YwtB (metallophosphatase superfamily)